MKTSFYCIPIEDGNRTILFDSMSKSFIQLRTDRFKEIYSNSMFLLNKLSEEEKTLLIKNGFLLEDSIDQQAVIITGKHHARLQKNSYHMIINPTLDCNLSCWYCYESHIANSRLNDELVEAICKHIEFKHKEDSIKFLHLSFFGGEPLLQFELIKKIIEYNEQNKYSYNYIINTNGINVNDSLIDLCKQKNILLNISLDGTLKSNSKNRFVEETFNLVENNIKAVKNKGIEFIINYVITPNNIEYINESLKYFIKNGFMDICFMINYDAFWTKKDIKLIKEQLEKSIPIMLKVIDGDFIKIYPIYNKINCIIEEKRETKCNFGKDSIAVSCDGKKYPCISFIYDNNYEIIHEDQIFTNICDIEKCKDCEYKDICNNNCMCRFCYHNKKSEVDVNCECEKIFIEIARKIVNKILNHELNEKV